MIIEYLSANGLEVLGTFVGLMYLYLEYRASIYLWIASIIMPAIYIFVYYDAGLYADFGIQIYYLLAAVYGFMVWKFFHKKEEKTLPITHMSVRGYVQASGMFAMSFAVILYVLLHYTNSDVPYCDTFTTALSIVAMWMLARKYVEQWLAWLIVDAVCTVLYVYKGIYATALLYALYTVIAVLGYQKWKRMMQV